jgi:Spy/CpxP family protein refolding chaperone
LSVTRNTLLAALALVLTFVAGFFAGAVAHHVVGPRIHRPRPMQAMMLHHLDRRLDLSDAQRAQIARILERRHARMRGEIEAVNGEIERVLTPEQRKIYAKIRMRPGRGPGPMHDGPMHGGPPPH